MDRYVFLFIPVMRREWRLLFIPVYDGDDLDHGEDFDGENFYSFLYVTGNDLHHICIGNA